MKMLLLAVIAALSIVNTEMALTQRKTSRPDAFKHEQTAGCVIGLSKSFTGNMEIFTEGDGGDDYKRPHLEGEEGR